MSSTSLGVLCSWGKPHDRDTMRHVPEPHYIDWQHVQKFHHDEGLAFTPADFVDGTNVGMIQGRCGTSFPAEAFERLRVSGNIFRQELQGDEATWFGVLSFIHHAHPTTAQLLNDALVRDGLADELGWSDH